MNEVSSQKTHKAFLFGYNNREKEIKEKVQDELQKIDPGYFVVITFDRSYTQNSI